MKTSIINIAQEKFFKFGYSKVRVDELAEELGISKKTIYNHFKGKEDILLKVMDKIKSDFETEILSIENNKELDYRELIQQVLESLGLWVSKISLFTSDLKKHMPSIHQKLTIYKRDVAIRHSTKILKQGVDDGYLEPNSDTQIALFMFLTTAERLIDEDFHKNLPKEMIDSFPLDPSERFRAIVNVLYNGLKIEKA